MTTKTLKITAISLLTTLAIFAPAANADTLGPGDFVQLTSVVSSGNGQLDLILFGFASAGADNATGTFDGDNANLDMPTGSSDTTISGSYITSIGELRDFYRMNFPDPNFASGSSVVGIELFLDIDETSKSDFINVNTFQIVVNPTPFGGGDVRDDPLNNDIDSPTQQSTGVSYTGGTVEAEIEPAITPLMLDLNFQGAGHADYAILTGVNPFDPAFADGDVIQFVWESSDHSNGGDKIFLSGTTQVVPEPATMGLLAMGSVALLRRRNK